MSDSNNDSSMDWKTKVLGKMPKAIIFSDKLDIEEPEYTDISFAVIPGQPVVTMMFEAAKITVSVAIAPLIGLDSMMVNALNYTAILTTPVKLKAETISRYVAAALDKINTVHIIEAQDVDTDKLAFRIQIDTRPLETQNMFCYHTVATIAVDQDVIDKTVELLTSQLRAYQLMIKPDTSSHTKH
jgi:hypothetical protein